MIITSQLRRTATITVSTTERSDTGTAAGTERRAGGGTTSPGTEIDPGKGRDQGTGTGLERRTESATPGEKKNPGL